MLKKLLIVLTLFSVTGSFAGEPRSPHWNSVRKQFLKTHQFCEVCGTAKSLQVHHIKPFHLYPDLELDESNLVVLCTSKYWGFNCHSLIGHGTNWKFENPWVVEDIMVMHKIASPGYLREYGVGDRDSYIKLLKSRLKEYNRKK